MSGTQIQQVQIEEGWKKELQEEFQKPYFGALKSFLQEERQKYVCYPPGALIFNAFNLAPFEQIKVVILGQDPYINPGQAHGLSFSVPDGVPYPPSLRNIYKELGDDLGIPFPKTGNLTPWAKQGVFLLNAVLTVRAGESGSHAGKGWELFTDAAISALNRDRENLVFLLWGNYAKQKMRLIDTNKHLVLTAGHPSPLSVKTFSGCKHFSKANEWLISKGLEPINWNPGEGN